MQAVAAGLSHATTGAAGKAFNGIRVAYQAGAGKVTSALVTTQQPDALTATTATPATAIHHSDPPPKKVSVYFRFPPWASIARSIWTPRGMPPPPHLTKCLSFVCVSRGSCRR